MEDKTKTIAELNDLFRMDDGEALGLSVLTQGIYALPPLDQFEIMHLVSEFEDFTPENDPHGEHDYGAFEHKGHKVIWKIDYYDNTLTCGSPDPSDPAQTTRVLTTMLASEY